MRPLFTTDTPAPIVSPPSAATDNLPATMTAAPSASRPAAVPVVSEAQIAVLGEQAASGLSALPNRLIGTVRNSDAGEFGQELTQLIGLAKGLDPSKLAGKGVLSRALQFFSQTKERLLAQYQTVEQRMDALVAELDRKASVQRTRIADLEQMYAANVTYHQQLEQAVERGAVLREQLRAQLAALPPAADSFDAQAQADVQRMLDRLEKRLDDLNRAMLLAKQTAPQIRLIQDNASALVQKFGDVKAVTLPAWKNAFSLYLLQIEQKQAVELATAVDDATDSALRRGADMLRQNSEDIAKARQRSVVSIETLEHVQQQLLGAIDDVQRVNDEGAARRKAEEPKLLAMEQELIRRFAPGQR